MNLFIPEPRSLIFLSFFIFIFLMSSDIFMYREY